MAGGLVANKFKYYVYFRYIFEITFLLTELKNRFYEETITCIAYPAGHPSG